MTQKWLSDLFMVTGPTYGRTGICSFVAWLQSLCYLPTCCFQEKKQPFHCSSNNKAISLSEPSKRDSCPSTLSYWATYVEEHLHSSWASGPLEASALCWGNVTCSSWDSGKPLCFMCMSCPESSAEHLESNCPEECGYYGHRDTVSKETSSRGA